MTNIQQALRHAGKALAPMSDSARIDAEVLLCHVLQCNRAYLYTYNDKELSKEVLLAYEQLVLLRQQGQPIAYLTGKQEFWSLPLKVNSHCLIPRPATEKLVEICLELIHETSHIKLLDLGTGSGAIALALASERPNWEITACDKSAECINIAKANAETLDLNHIQFLTSHWYSNINETQFDVIVSNPPYIAEDDPHLHQGDVRFEPESALIAANQGLEDIETISQQASAHLKPGGILIVEHGYQQKNEVAALFKKAGFKQIRCWQDDEKHERISAGTLINH